MAACPAASSSSRSRRERLALAGLLVYLVGLGGTLPVFIVEPDLAWLSLFLLVVPAALALCCVRLPARLSAVLVSLAALAIASCASGVYPRAGWEATLWLTVWLGLLVVGYRTVRSAAQVDEALAVVVPAVALVSLVGALQALGKLPIMPAYMTEHGRTRVLSTLNHPNNLASYLALTLPLVLSAAGVAAVRRRWSLLVGHLVIVLAMLLCGAATYSRGGQLGIAAGLLTLVLCCAAAMRMRRRTAVLAVIVLAVVAGGCLASPLGHRFRLALAGIGHLGDDQRAGTWRAATAMVAERPWLGVGPGAFFVSFARAKAAGNHAELFTHAHNWYLHTAAEGGLPALALLLYLLAGAAQAAWRACRNGTGVTQRLTAAGLCAGTIGYAVAGLLDVSTGVPAVAVTAWLVLGMAWGLTESAQPRTVWGRAPGWAVAALLLVLFATWTVWNRGHQHYQRALAAWCTGAWSHGAAELERARALDPGQRAYLLVRIDLAQLAGRADLAQEMLARLERRGQLTDSPYRVLLAELRARQGDQEGALAVLRHTAEVTDRAQPAVWSELGWSSLESDATAARVAFEHALARHPEQLSATMGLAALAARQQEPAHAVTLLAGAEQIGLARDRLPRLLVGYGRLDPLLVVPIEQRGHFRRSRYSWHGAVLPALTASLYAEWAESSPWR
ncbi:MAG: O-antigen ligase family protein [Armatimonadetes bacterium]|nr:O-antigen ligase family protein [Armatimonadota bacterium]